MTVIIFQKIYWSIYIRQLRVLLLNGRCKLAITIIPIKRLIYWLSPFPFLNYSDDDSVDTNQKGNRNEGGGSGSSLQGPPVGANPFLDIPQNITTVEYKKGYVMRKCCFDSNNKKSKLKKFNLVRVLFDSHMCDCVSGSANFHKTIAYVLILVAGGVWAHKNFIFKAYERCFRILAFFVCLNLCIIRAERQRNFVCSRLLWFLYSALRKEIMEDVLLHAAGSARYVPS